MPRSESDLQKVLNALSDPRRRRALAIVWGNDAEHCVCELMTKLGTSQPNTSRHMKVLREAGLVTDRRDAQWTRYRANTDMPGRLRRIVEAVLACEPTTPFSEYEEIAA